MLVEPLAADSFKGVGLPALDTGLRGLSLGAGVDAVGQQRLGLIAPLPSFFQADGGIGAEGDALLLALHAVFQTPPLAAAGASSKYRPPSNILTVLLCGLAARMAVSVSGMGATLRLRFLLPPDLPPKVVDVKRPETTSLENAAKRNRSPARLFTPCGTSLFQEMVGPPGLEPGTCRL